MATDFVEKIKNALASFSMAQKVALAATGVAIVGGTAGATLGIAQYNNNEKSTELIESTTAYIQEYKDESSEKVSEKNNNLTATSADFKLLTDFINDFMYYAGRYDYKSRDAKEIAFTSLMCSHFTDIVYNNFFDDYKEVYDYNDPLGKFKLENGFDRYFIFPGKSMDWIITNVFNLTPDHSYTNDWAYYKDGNYYVGLIASGGDIVENSVIKSVRGKNGVYEILIKCDYYIMGDETPDISYYKIKAAFRSDNGKKYWSLYEMYETSSLDALEAETTATSSTVADAPSTTKSVKTEGWKKAYNKYLKDMYDEIAAEGYVDNFQDMSFTLAYIDDDNIPELLISEGSYTAAQVRVLTYKNNKIKDLGSYGSVGCLSYVEKGSVIYSSFFKQGRYSDSYYKMNSNGKFEEFFSSFSNAASGDPLLYKINNVEVSREEYNRQTSAMESTYKLKSNEDGCHEFTYENFDKYCR